MNVITAEGLVKIYKTRKNEVRALDSIDLAVEAGTVLARGKVVITMLTAGEARYDFVRSRSATLRLRSASHEAKRHRPVLMRLLEIERRAYLSRFYRSVPDGCPSGGVPIHRRIQPDGQRSPDRGTDCSAHTKHDLYGCSRYDRQPLPD